MISKKSVAVISFLAIASLTSIGFSTFYIIPSTETSINTTVGDVLDFNELVKNKLVTYTITENGFFHSEDNADTITKNRAEISLSFSLYTYKIQNAIGIDTFTTEFTFYIYFYENNSTENNSTILNGTATTASSTIIYWTSTDSTSTFQSSPIYEYFDDENLLLITYKLQSLGESEDETNSFLNVSLEISFTLESDAFDDNYDDLVSSNYFYFYVGVDI